MRLVICAALLFTCETAFARDQIAQSDDPDTERARRYYESGAQQYAAGHYSEAIAEFEKARALKPAPGLEFNIARSYDRMGNTEKALAAYRLYLDSAPDDAEQVRARVKVLEERAAAEATPQAAKPPPQKRRTWVYVVAAVAAVAVAGVAVGVGVGLGARPSDPTPQQGVLHW